MDDRIYREGHNGVSTVKKRERKRVGMGKSVLVRVGLGGGP